MKADSNLVLGMLGAVAGGALGYFVFLWAAGQGFYALMLPGALTGAGSALLAKDRSVLRATLCGVLALGLGLFSEWRSAPFIADKTLGYFLGHVYQLRPLTLVMVVGGGAFG